MHLRREIDGKLDDLIDEIKALNKYKDGESPINHRLAVEDLKQEIIKLTNSGERSKGLWTEAPEFAYPNIFTKN
jgi:hypothetical protein